MTPYFVKKLFLRAAIALPAPRLLYRACRLYQNAKDGENFGDMTINGEVRFLRSQAGACRVVFDVGANRGEWTRHAVAATEGARIHCFEPASAAFETLVGNGFPSRVVCHRLGLSDEAGEGRIHVATGSLYGGRAHAHDDPAALPTEVVQLDTLDGYCSDHAIEQIDLLKLDVEGHEMAVLRGGRKMLLDGRIKRVQFEYGPCNIDSRVLLRDFFDLFVELNFALYQITPHRLAEVKRYDPRRENFQYKNFAALHRSLDDATP